MQENNTESGAPRVDGYGVIVANADVWTAYRVFLAHGLDPVDLDGPTGDELDRQIGAGNIDGAEPQDLAKFADVLDDLDAARIDYSADVLAYGAYFETLEYMESRGRVDIRPTYTTVDDGLGPIRTHDGGFTPGDYELSTVY